MKVGVITRNREGYFVTQEDHGTLQKCGCSWPNSISEDTNHCTIPKFTPTRVLHIREYTLPMVDDYAKSWWDMIAPPELASLEKARRQAERFGKSK